MRQVSKLQQERKYGIELSGHPETIHTRAQSMSRVVSLSAFAAPTAVRGSGLRRRERCCDVQSKSRFRYVGVRWRLNVSSSHQNARDSSEPVGGGLANRKVVVTGGTGLIGRALVESLRKADSNVCLLARNPSKARSLFAGRKGPLLSVLRYDAAAPEPLTSAAYDAVTNADIVINLAGEPVEDGRWTAERKGVLFNSRVTGTRKIADALRAEGSETTLINASAVGYYGTSEEKTFTEEDGPGADFLATTAKAWEEAALRNSGNSRTVVFRIGVVLANGGGALEKMSAAFKAYLGGPPGGGTQWFSWVHIDDVVRLIISASIDPQWEGVYNANAPQPVRLAEFCKELGYALGRPSWLPVPRQAVQALLGNEAAELILAGQHVLPKRTRANGFVYRYKDVASALQQLTRARKGTLTNVK